MDFENEYFTALLNVYNICIIGTCYMSLVVSVAADEIILQACVPCMIWIAWYDSHSSIPLFSMDMLDCFNWFLSFYNNLLFFFKSLFFSAWCGSRLYFLFFIGICCLSSGLVLVIFTIRCPLPLCLGGPHLPVHEPHSCHTLFNPENGGRIFI